MTDIEKYRKELDLIDSDIVQNLNSRMDVIRKLSEYKKNNDIPIIDKSREKVIIDNIVCSVKNEYVNYYKQIFDSILNVSKQYQNELISNNAILVSTSLGDYDIVLDKGSIFRINDFFNLNRKVIIITDDGLPKQYLDVVLNQCEHSFLYVIPSGEKSKSKQTVKLILDYMFDCGFDKNDCVLALGGGVVTDLSGFVASIYKRGIDYYSIPTTLLSMVDASIGAKNGINYCDYKNQIGTFYQPKRILIDINTLETLSKRHLSNGFIEALKMGLTHDKELFDVFLNGKENSNIDYIIKKSILIKKSVVEQDLFDNNVRKSLNFGHTIGHALEKYTQYSDFLHGECVAKGMHIMSSYQIRPVLSNIYQRLNIPDIKIMNIDDVIESISYDKKKSGNVISEIFVDEIGSYKCLDLNISDYKDYFIK